MSKSMVMVFALCSLVLLSSVGDAANVTGNLAGWNGVDAEAMPNGVFPIFQGVTLPDPGPGNTGWLLDSLTFAAIGNNWWEQFDGSRNPSHGFEAWLIPTDAPFVDFAAYTDRTGDAVAHFAYVHPNGEAIPENGPSFNSNHNALLNVVAPEVDGLGIVAPAGTYYLEIQPLPWDETAAPVGLAIGRDGGANTYPGGQEAYFQANPWATVGVNENHDLSFQLDGTAIPEPATMALLGLGGMALRRRKN